MMGVVEALRRGGVCAERETRAFFSTKFLPRNADPEMSTGIDACFSCQRRWGGMEAPNVKSDLAMLASPTDVLGGVGISNELGIAR